MKVVSSYKKRFLWHFAFKLETSINTLTFSKIYNTHTSQNCCMGFFLNMHEKNVYSLLRWVPTTSFLTTYEISGAPFSIQFELYIVSKDHFFEYNVWYVASVSNV